MQFIISICGGSQLGIPQATPRIHRAIFFVSSRAGEERAGARRRDIIFKTSCAPIARSPPILRVAAKFKVLHDHKREAQQTSTRIYRLVRGNLSTVRVYAPYFLSYIDSTLRYRVYFGAPLSVLPSHCTFSSCAKFHEDLCSLRCVLEL